jgi:ATP-dependent Clp protease ATP-binding subunit ClpA
VFERFTTGAREAVAQAQTHARRLHHPGTGTSHLLLALVGSDGPTGDLLRARGITIAAAEAALTEVLARDPAPGAPAGSRDPDADAVALAAIGVDLARIRAAVEAAFGPGALDDPTPEERGRRGLSGWGGRRGRGTRTCGAAWFGPDAKKALELSLREALRLKDRHIGEEHLLLGLLRGGDNVAVGMLGALGVDAADLRRAVEERHRRSA